MSGGSCRDLRDQMNNPKVQEAFGLLLSGKKGYKPVIERRVEPLICAGCNVILREESKFCPECGTKVVKPVAASQLS